MNRLKKCLSLFALSAILLSCGGGNSNPEEKKESNQTKIGNWQVREYVDEFNEKTGEKYLLIEGEGVFSNSATANSPLGVRITVDKEYSSISVYEYKGAKEFDDYLTMKIKEPNGDIHQIETYKGLVVEREGVNNDSIFREILKRGGELKFSAVKFKYGNESSYSFKVDNVDHYQDAVKNL